MSYRRDGEGPRAWQAWVGRRRDALIKCGLPEFVYSDEPRWFGFLEHDGWDQESGWKVAMLSPTQASAFHDFLASEYDVGDYRGLLRNLKSASGGPGERRGD